MVKSPSRFRAGFRSFRRVRSAAAFNAFLEDSENIATLRHRRRRAPLPLSRKRIVRV
jgi:hypothetical protein